MTETNLPTGALVIREGARGPYFEAKWYQGGRQVKRRIGPAWLVKDEDAGWKKRRGRAPEGQWTAKTATVRMAELIREHSEHEGQHRTNRDVTFGEASDAWLSYLSKADRAKPSTLRDYELILSRPIPKRRGNGKRAARIMRAFGDRKLRSITTVDVERFLSRLDSEGMSTRSVNKHRAVLHAVCEYACRPGTFGLRENPVSASEKRRERAPQLIEYFTREELEAIVREAEKGSARNRPAKEFGPQAQEEWERLNQQDAAIITVAGHTGLRQGELRALRWQDIDLAKSRITVAQAVSAGVIGPPKSGKPRTVPLSDKAAQRLARLMNRGRYTEDGDLVFCGYRGDVLDGPAITKRFRRLQEHAGVAYRHFHVLRHTFCSHMVAEGAALTTVRDWAGHSSISVTERYLHSRSQESDAAFITRVFSLPDVTIEAAPVAQS
jgi:integrase